MGGLQVEASGMNAMEQSMAAIGDNIANIDSTGYKEKSDVFAELFNQQTRGASAPTANLGAQNPIVQGSGVELLGQQINMAEGQITNTGNPTNLAITGDGWFVVDGGNGSQLFTRAGAFSLGPDGSLVTAGGQRVMGYMAKNGVLPPPGSGTLQDITGLSTTALAPASATTAATWSGNLQSGSTTPVVVSGTVYDAQGDPITLQVTFTPPATPGNPWAWNVTGPAGATGSGSVTFTASGAYSTSTGGPISVPGLNGAPALSIAPDFTGLTQFNAATSVDMSTQNGYPAGLPVSLSVSADGVISVAYNNGQTLPVAQVALAVFSNEQGLSGGTGGLFKASPASGTPSIGEPGTGGRSTIAPDSLEGSNVSLTEQFSKLIAVQHDFAADSQAMSAESLMLQSLQTVQI